MKCSILLLFPVLILMSCGGGDDEPQKVGNCLTAVIDGEDFTAETTTGTFIITNIDYETLGNQETRLLTINGTIPSLTGDTRTISLSFACSEFTSDLDFVESDSDCGIAMNYSIQSFTNPAGAIAVSATTGSINVEELTDTHIKGTFVFSGEDQNGVIYNITEGFFDTTIE